MERIVRTEKHYLNRRLCENTKHNMRILEVHFLWTLLPRRHELRYVYTHTRTHTNVYLSMRITSNTSPCEWKSQWDMCVSTIILSLWTQTKLLCYHRSPLVPQIYSRLCHYETDFTKMFSLHNRNIISHIYQCYIATQLYYNDIVINDFLSH